MRGPSRTRPLTPGRPRVDSLPPLSRCPRALRSARANSTPVDSCRLLSIRLLTHAAPHALGPARTPSSRRAAPVPSRRESTGVDRNRVARRSRPQGPAQIEAIAPLRATKSPAWKQLLDSTRKNRTRVTQRHCEQDERRNMVQFTSS